MVIVYLNKDLKTGKMLVTKWIVMSKEKAIDYPNIPGYRVAFYDKDVPMDFYRNGHKYLVDDGVLRKSYL